VSLTRINPSGESLFALGEKLFALGEIVFGFWKVEPILREIHFASGEIDFGLGEAVFRLKQLVFGFREVEFMFKEFVCRRDVTERRSKMIGRFDLQVLCGDQASISRISNCQQPPKNAK
jgi:hypothetical protein